MFLAPLNSATQFATAPTFPVDQHIKRNLIIFVTAHLVTPGGQRVNETEEEEEQDLVQPPVLPEIPAYKK